MHNLNVVLVEMEGCPGRDGRHLESFREIWMNVVLAKQLHDA